MRESSWTTWTCFAQVKAHTDGSKFASGMANTAWALDMNSRESNSTLVLCKAELKHPNAGVEKKDHEKWVVQLAELVGDFLHV